ncbi:AAA family ATPase [Roseovarius sp. C7]|uniref:AAA family ATPase n=1 Tax=Roseovarius sp. C7 TaxID=3398643 RepID=UPI0039F6E6F7
MAQLDDAWSYQEMGEIDRLSAQVQRSALIEEQRRTLKPDHFDLIWSAPSHLTFLSPADCEDLPARNYLIKGLLGEGDISAVVGAPGAGKSLLAPYLGFAVAQGVEAFGLRTRQGSVFYVAAEDSHGMRARVQALRTKRGDAHVFKLVEGVSDLLSNNSEDLKALLVAVEDQRPALIVIDTLAVAFPGLEENDAKSMGTVVSVARKLTRWGAAVVLVHHDTKEGSGLPRGHSILNGALDMSLHLKRDGKVVRVRPTKNRNGSTDHELAFSVGTVQLGTDEDGDMIWAATCDEENAGNLTKPGKPLPPSAKAALEILENLARDGRFIPKSEWRAACVASDAVSGADKIDDRRQAFRRAIEQLARRKLFISEGEQIRLTESPDMLLGSEEDA